MSCFVAINDRDKQVTRWGGWSPLQWSLKQCLARQTEQWLRCTSSLGEDQMLSQPPAEQERSQHASQKAEQLLATASMRLNIAQSHQPGPFGLLSPAVCCLCRELCHTAQLSTLLWPGMCSQCHIRALAALGMLLPIVCIASAITGLGLLRFGFQR